MLEFGLLAFVSLFAVVEPIGVLPIYVAMTAALSPRESRRVAFRAVLTALAVLVAFALAGSFVFQFFQISVHSLRVVGGVIFFAMGYEMLQARISRTQLDEESTREYIEDIAITPLGIPMIAGPGAITTVMIFMNDSHTLENKLALLLAILAVLALTLLFLISAKRIIALLGTSGNKVLMRLMGLIVMAFAVEFFFSGIRPFVQSIK